MAAGPFLIWAIDSILGLYPPHPDTGTSSAVLGGDIFGKWVEGAPLAKLNSYHTTVWLHNKLVCRYGTPLTVHIDRESEYRSTFLHYCKLAGI